MDRIIIHIVLLIASIVHNIVLFDFAGTIFSVRDNKKCILLFSFIINLILTYFSTAIILPPGVTGILTILGWSILLVSYEGKIKEKVLYMFSFFVISSVLELCGFYFLMIDNIKIVNTFDRIRAFVIATILSVLVLLIFKYLFQFGSLKINVKSIFPIYVLPIIGLIFDTIIFYKEGNHTFITQSLVILCSLLLAVNSIWIVNILNRKDFELQRYVSLNQLFKEQKNKINSLERFEHHLSKKVHQSDKALINLYKTLQKNDVEYAKDLVEKRLLELNSGLVKINNSSSQISIELLIEKIQKICKEKNIEFISGFKMNHSIESFNFKDQIALLSVIVNYVLEELDDSTDNPKSFTLKIYSSTSRMNIFVSYSKTMPISQLSKLKYRDFSQKSYALQFVEIIVKKYSGHISLRLKSDSFGILLTLNN